MSCWIKEIKRVRRRLCCDIVLGDVIGLSIVNKLKASVLKRRITNKKKTEMILGEMYEMVMVMISHAEKNIIVSKNN